MAADCSLTSSPHYTSKKVPIFRGTQGLWREYPAFRRQLIKFESLVEENFFHNEPKKFWFVYGDIFQRYRRAQPHIGFIKLRDIVWRSGKE
jgi:NAD-dependent SIR2 family protein deacetylase